MQFSSARAVEQREISEFLAGLDPKGYYLLQSSATCCPREVLARATGPGTFTTRRPTSARSSTSAAATATRTTSTSRWLARWPLSGPWGPRTLNSHQPLRNWPQTCLSNKSSSTNAQNYSSIILPQTASFKSLGETFYLLNPTKPNLLSTRNCRPTNSY